MSRMHILLHIVDQIWDVAIAGPTIPPVVCFDMVSHTQATSVCCRAGTWPFLRQKRIAFCSLHPSWSHPTWFHLLQGVLIPIFSRTKWAIFQPGHLLMSMMNCFAGGVFLTFGFMHFLGDAADANTATLGDKYNLVSWATTRAKLPLTDVAGLQPGMGCRGFHCCLDAAEARVQVWATNAHQ